MKELFRKLTDSWLKFLRVILDWPALLLLACLVFLIIFPPKPEDRTTTAIFNVIFALISSVLGAFIYSKWTQEQEKKVLVARGETAIRNLVVLQQNILRLSKRVNDYLKLYNSTKSEQINKDIYKLQLEEVVEKCYLISDEAASAIQNWADLIPGAKLAEKNQVFLAYTSRINELEDENQTLKLQYNAVMGQAGKEKEELMKQIEKNERTLKHLRHELGHTLFHKQDSSSAEALLYPVSTSFMTSIKNALDAVEFQNRPFNDDFGINLPKGPKRSPSTSSE